MNINGKIAAELGIRESQVAATVQLIDEGNTIPFIARYRKEVTGSLDDEVLRALDERLRYLRNLEERKETVIASIEEQGKMTEDLRKAIDAAETLVAVEDIYRPYKPKRKTRATIAKAKGLEPLAETIKAQEIKGSLQDEAAKYVRTDAEHPELEVADAAAAIAGACDIIAEEISDSAEFRAAVRRMTFEGGMLVSAVKDEDIDEKKTYGSYYDYSEPVRKMPGHRILAVNRGEKEKVLGVSIEAPTDEIIAYLQGKIITRTNPATGEVLRATIEDAYKRLIKPSIENEIRSELTENAEDGAIKVFGENLGQLLMQPPIAGMTVLGWDPAFRTGCKLAVVDPTGKVLDTTVIYPTPPQNRVEESVAVVLKLIKKYGINLISLGNGTASRESEKIICDMIKDNGLKVQYIIVNEAGASVYSASKLATEEFPNFDVGQRSATSMARRLQDPLSELVKIDPKSVGVGQYQHDMNQKKLEASLAAVVEDCVNAVGVDLNTASASLLQYVSGINKTLANNIVEYREANGSFGSRKELLKVAKLGPKAFEQCAGFLRIRGGKEPLDGTAVHPESYDVAKKLLAKLGHSAGDLKEKLAKGGMSGVASGIKSYKETAAELGIGEPTLRDIVKELEKPGRDPRDEMPAPILKSDVLEMEDLTEGMILKGTVRNVIDFGAFVDIGVHQDGLVHISQMADRYIKHPLEVVSVGDIVEVKVLSVDLKKQRIALTMKL
ncbi:MAG: RNA-binding transcriptional accessory protein [Clostridiales bacterium]|nr:RNA-binding transcriptional accessory protein [Candidatus Crickella caballi]